MYAVIETGGKQYRVEVGTELAVEKLDVEPGTSVTLDRVLLVADGDEASIGRPLVADAAVEAEVVRQDRGEKLIVFKYRPKARRRVKKGHRQNLTFLRITDVRFNGRSAAEAARKAQDEALTERQRLEEAAARQAAEDAKLAARLAKKAEPAADAETKAAPKKARAKKAEAAEADAGAAAAEAPAETEAQAPEAQATEAPASEAPASEADETTTEAPKRSRSKKSE